MIFVNIQAKHQEQNDLNIVSITEDRVRVIRIRVIGVTWVRVSEVRVSEVTVTEVRVAEVKFNGIELLSRSGSLRSLV